MDLKEEKLLGDRVGSHWYYRAKLAALAAVTGGMAPREVLDVGSGSGFFPRELLRSTGLREATCVDSGYEDDRDEDVCGKRLRFRREVGHSDADLVLMMDVVEHVPDDAALIAGYAAKVASGTRFFVTAPAFGWLWSGHDVFLGHHRRYTLRGLEDALVRGGLHVRGGCYFYGALLPLAAVTRFVGRVTGRGSAPRSQMRASGAAVNAALGSVCRAEMPFFRANRLAGLTAMAWAVKP